MFRRQRRHHGVKKPLRHRRAAGGHGVRVEMQAHIAQQHQGPPRQGEVFAVRRRVAPILLQAALEDSVVLEHLSAQVALHQAQPVPVHPRLVLRVNGRHRILAIHDHADRRLQLHIINASQVVAPYVVAFPQAKLNMQGVVPQQDAVRRLRVPRVAGETLPFAQAMLAAVPHHAHQLARAHLVLRHMIMAAHGHGGGAVQESARVADHIPAPHRVVFSSAPPPPTFGDDIGAVQRVVKAPPAGVGGVQRVSGVVHWRHQLGAGDAGDLVIGARDGDLEIAALGDKIADVLQEPALGLRIMLRIVPVPAVDPGLKRVSPGQQGAVLGPQVGDNAGQAGPEVIGIHPRVRRDLIAHQVMQALVYGQTMQFDSLIHRNRASALTFGQPLGRPTRTSPT